MQWVQPATPYLLVSFLEITEYDVSLAQQAPNSLIGDRKSLVYAFQLIEVPGRLLHSIISYVQCNN